MEYRFESLLKHYNLWDLLNKEFIFIGGSLPSYVCSPFFSGKDGESKIFDEIGDIDIYTNDTVKFRKYLEDNIVARTFKLVGNSKYVASVEYTTANGKHNIKIQFIMPQFKDFIEDILHSYDSDLVGIGYHPYTKKIFYSWNYLQSMSKQNFRITHTYNNLERLGKLMNRTSKWYNSEFTIYKDPRYKYSDAYEFVVGEYRELSSEIKHYNRVFNAKPQYRQIIKFYTIPEEECTICLSPATTFKDCTNKVIQHKLCYLCYLNLGKNNCPYCKSKYLDGVDNYNSDSEIDSEDDE